MYFNFVSVQKRLAKCIQHINGGGLWDYHFYFFFFLLRVLPYFQFFHSKHEKIHSGVLATLKFQSKNVRSSRLGNNSDEVKFLGQSIYIFSMISVVIDDPLQNLRKVRIFVKKKRQKKIQKGRKEGRKQGRSDQVMLN